MDLQIAIVAAGDTHWRLARCLVRSLRAHGVQAPVSIMVDRQLPWQPAGDTRLLRVPGEAPGFASREHKTSAHKHIGKAGDRLLLLDADILLLRPLGGLAEDLLAPYGMRPRGIGPAADAAHVQEALDTVAEVGAAATHWDSGVIAWTRSAAMDSLFDAWNTAWKEYRSRDEFALVRAQHRTGLYPAPLPEVLNSRNMRTAVLWHHHRADPDLIERFCDERGWPTV